MSTPAQIAACAANAQHSTGPRSPEGKAVSSRNALKLGLYSQSDILPGEDPAEFDQLLHDFEAQFINLRHADLTAEEQEFPLGAIYAKDAEGPNVLQKIERRRAAALRQ